MKIFSLILLFFSFQSWGEAPEFADGTPAQYTMEITEDSVVYGCNSDPCSNELVFEEAETASGTTPTSTVYVPIYDEFLNLGYDPQTATNTIGSNIEYSIFTQLTPNSSSPTNTLPSYNQNAANTSIVKHEFTIQNPTTVPMYVYAAVVNPANKEELRIIGSNTTSNYFNLGTIPESSRGDYWINLRLYDLCTSAENSYYQTLCTGLKSFDPTDLGPHYPDVQIYFFLTSCSSIPDPVSEDSNCKYPPSSTIATYPGGIYFKYFLGNIVNTAPPFIDSLAKGDERLKVNFSGNGIFYLSDVIAIKYPETASATEQTYFQAILDGGALASYDNGAQNSGYITLKNLINNQTIKVGVAYVNKFKFATLISEGDEQTPQAIQTFLQEKECYLLSAGFQKDHFVLEYFREIRDNFLLKNIWGRGFVKWYYKTAPYYAGIIYENAFLRLVVKSLGYVTYFTLKFFPIILFLLFIPSIIFTFRKFKIIKE